MPGRIWLLEHLHIRNLAAADGYAYLYVAVDSIYHVAGVLTIFVASLGLWILLASWVGTAIGVSCFF